MAKNKKVARQFTLRPRHETPFRRTVRYKSGSTVQLVFQPGELYPLDDEEIAALDDQIKAGLIIEATFDDKGRLRYPNQQMAKAVEAIIAELEAKIEKLASANAELREENDELRLRLAERGTEAEYDALANADSQ